MSDRETVYLETSVVSYLTARQSRDIVTLAHQEITRDWWSQAADRFAIVVSQVVIDEAAGGDPEQARQRLDILRQFPRVPITDAVEWLMEQYIANGIVPAAHLRDAAHVALATVHDVSYLVTWNCRHIANAFVMRKIMALNNKLGF